MEQATFKGKISHWKDVILQYCAVSFQDAQKT